MTIGPLFEGVFVQKRQLRQNWGCKKPVFYRTLADVENPHGDMLEMSCQLPKPQIQKQLVFRHQPRYLGLIFATPILLFRPGHSAKVPLVSENVNLSKVGMVTCW